MARIKFYESCKISANALIEIEKFLNNIDMTKSYHSRINCLLEFHNVIKFIAFIDRTLKTKYKTQIQFMADIPMLYLNLYLLHIL